MRRGSTAGQRDPHERRRELCHVGGPDVIGNQHEIASRRSGLGVTAHQSSGTPPQAANVVRAPGDQLVIDLRDLMGVRRRRLQDGLRRRQPIRHDRLLDGGQQCRILSD